MLKYSLRLISMAVVMTIALSGIWAMPALTQTFSLWSDESMSSCSAYMYQYETFTVYVFLEPGPDGAFAAEYKLVVPDSIISISDEPNSFISTAGTIGTPVGPPGISAPFTSCQNSITWVYKHTFILMGQRDPSYITMYPNDDSGFMGVATCEEPMRPMVDASLYNFFGVNSSCTANPAPYRDEA